MKNRDVAAVCSGPEQMRGPAWRFVNSVEPANDRSIMRNCTGGGLSVLTAAERISSLEKASAPPNRAKTHNSCG
jgi:hypothetical protein